MRTIKKHGIAILSLFIAILALGYTTWREEVTEHNRNMRIAAFEVLKNLGELQVIVNETIYAHADSAFPIPEKTEKLAKVWGENWEKIKSQESAQDAITNEIDTCREAVLTVLHSLR
jgi:hypothetical protein